MLVAMWMTRDPATIRPTTSIADAAMEMARRRFRHLVVTPKPGPSRVLGLVSLHDLARAFPPDLNPLSAAGISQGPQRTVGEIMTRDPLTVAPDTPLEVAARLMLERKFGALPIVRDDALVGIITQNDIVRAFLEGVGGADPDAPAVRITVDVSGDEDIVGLVLELARTHALRVASVLTMKHEGRPLAVARLVGADVDEFVAAMWRSGHRVLSVLRT